MAHYISRMEYEYRNLPQYQEWLKVKEKIKSQYPQEMFEEKPKMSLDIWYKYWKQYRKQLMDEILKPNSIYQELTWEMMGQVERLEQERKARGRIYGGNGEYS